MTTNRAFLTRAVAASVAALALAVGLAACGRTPEGGNTPPPSSIPSGGILHPLGADQLVLRVETPPGPTMNPSAVVILPAFSLFGDGTVVIPAPVPEIYPGPALPPLQTLHLTESGVQALLQAAKKAGLLGPDKTYNTPPMADAGFTIFTVNADGAIHSINVLGLGGGITDDTPHADRLARQALSAFAAELSNLTSWLPAGSVGAQHAYQASRLQVSVRPGAPNGTPGLTQQFLDWPLSPALSSWGDPQQGPGPVRVDYRCGEASGSDLQTLLPLVATANQLTGWRSGVAMFTLIFRPLLPDQKACPPSAAL